MAKDSRVELLQWTKQVQNSDVQDPLGLRLRGSARLSSELFFCITSITPRARYFSFLPWCIHDWRSNEVGKSHAFGLKDAIRVREKALTLGCTAHHDRHACDGGGLVGSTEAIRWLQDGKARADLDQLKFSKNPAFDAYFNSLVNLGFFNELDEQDESEEEEADNKITMDDLELSELGQSVADRYQTIAGQIEQLRVVSDRRRVCSIEGIKELGRLGGLCELTGNEAPDRELLRNVFLANSGLKTESHIRRRHSLALILETVRQLATKEFKWDRRLFQQAVYFGEVDLNDSQMTIQWPTNLKDIAERWRMFYFHHFMAVALEGLFAWCVTRVSDVGVKGESIESMAESLESPAVKDRIEEILGQEIQGSFADLTPAQLLSGFTENAVECNAECSEKLDDGLRLGHQMSEFGLETIAVSRKELNSPNGLAIPMVLLVTTLTRFSQWEKTPVGGWFAGTVKDSFLDLVPPLVLHKLKQRFPNWWDVSFIELAEFVLSRCVVEQHISLSYSKSKLADRCLLDREDNNVRSFTEYDNSSMGNARLNSALQILIDLAFVNNSSEDGVLALTEDGKACLSEVLSPEQVDG